MEYLDTIASETETFLKVKEFTYPTPKQFTFPKWSLKSLEDV